MWTPQLLQAWRWIAALGSTTVSYTHLVDLAGISGGIGLQMPQLLIVLTQPGGEFLLAQAKPVQPRNDIAPLVVQHVERSGEQRQQLLLLLLFRLLREGMDLVLSLRERFAALRCV